MTILDVWTSFCLSIPPLMDVGFLLGFHCDDGCAWMNSFGWMYRSGIDISYENSIFNFWRNFHTVFHSDYSIFCPQQCMKCSSSFRLSPVLDNFFFDNSLLMGVSFDLLFPLMISNAETLLLCLSAICRSPLKKCPSKSLAHVKIKLKWYLS